MKTIFFSVMFALVGFTSNAQTNHTQSTQTTQNRQPAYQQTSNSSGLTPAQQTYQAQQSKPVLQQAWEGSMRTMERYEGGGEGATAAAAATTLYNAYTTGNSTTPPPAQQPTQQAQPTSTGRAVEQ